VTAAARAQAPAAQPVIPGFFPDPSVCRVGEDCYVACSSFEYFPGLPILHSRDLVSWVHIANALDRPEQLDLAGAPSSGGVFAPTLRHHDGRFRLVTTDGSTGTHLVFTADDPAGPWSVPTRITGAPGIDPDLAWDADGTCWLTYSEGGVGRSGRIKQARVDLDAGALLETPREIWSGTGLQFPEAPHLHEVDGTWYLVIAEGGTERGHAVSIARGPAPDGPFEGFAGNPVLSHRSTDHPVQNVGHADLVEAADGRWWAVLHGTRPLGVTPGFHALGRETFLAPVAWVDGWPRLGPLPRDGGPRAAVLERDDFEGAGLGPAWVSVRRRAGAAASLTRRPGRLTLDGTGAGLDDREPVFVGRRQAHQRCTVRAHVDATDGSGGLAVRLDEHHHYGIEADGAQVRVTARIGPLADTVARAACTGPAVLSVAIEPGERHATLDRPAPDVVRFGFECDGRRQELAALDGRYVTTEVAGGFTGRVVGLFATAGTVAFDWFEYEGTA
jgi:xylan 1,4-beta-xylosidase